MSTELSFVVAVDIGTTSTKVMLIDHTEQVIRTKSIPYPIHSPRSDMAEQEPQQILEAVMDGINSVMETSGIDPNLVLCVTFSSAMHSIIVMNAQHQTLTKSIIWADQRSVDEAEELIRNGNAQSIYHHTGTPIHPMSPLTKLMWLRDHDSETFQQAHKFIGIKEYVFHRLFGEYMIDYSIASGTGMFNIHNMAWDEQALTLIGINTDQLSEPVPTTYVIHGLTCDYASKMSINMNTPFVIGAADGVLANLGMGVVNSEEVAISIGTSSAVRAMVRRPTLDPQGRMFCYALLDDYWVIGGASNNGGIVLQWTIDQLFSNGLEPLDERNLEPFTSYLELAQQSPPGADGLLFLPLLTGERAPFWDARARGVYFGLSLNHGKSHMLRAAMEGMIFQIGSIMSMMQDISISPRKITASGGVTRSVLICQMLADVLGIPVEVPDVIESSGLGAARLGFYAMGISDQICNPITSTVSTTNVLYLPNEENHQLYQRILPIYLNVYHQLKDSYKEIAELQ
ncbi:gluconokinase [Paenibacillus sp. CMAA1364]